jgi:thymidylate synthase (FAD)
MKLIKQSFEILDQQCGLEGIYKQIEISGRTCYKSEDKITEDSAKEFVDRMIKSGHGAMLEHGTVYLAIPISEWRCTDDYRDSYISNPYSNVNDSLVDWENNEGIVYITTNLRVLVENGWLDDLQYICEPTEYHEKRITVKFTTDQGILREFTRHRVFSFAVESTRYCNYSKNRFSNEVTFIQPNWISDEDIKDYHINYNYFIDQDTNHITAVNRFISALKNAEYFYMELIKLGWKPQQARNILPLATKCDMVMTGFVSDWLHFFALRDAASAHPQAQELAHSLHEAFIQRGLIK